MSNKVILSFEDEKYRIYINETLFKEKEDIDASIEEFRKVIKNNSVPKSISWDTIVERLKAFNNQDLEINNDYQTVAFGSVKYFYNTAKLFYMENGQMFQLIGGFDLLYFIVKLASENTINNYDELLKLCKEIIEVKGNYRVYESTMFISSAKFSYGAVEYDFSTNKVNKGTSFEKGTFEEFKSYVLSILK